MYNIQSTPTEYDGYVFRSYLEARWAAFFNALRVPYRYEPKWFDLGRWRYLPDFWLPTLDAWIEIKPTPLHVIKVDAKLCRFATVTDAKVVLFCDGPCVPISGWRYWPKRPCSQGHQFIIEGERDVKLTDQKWWLADHPRITNALVAADRFLDRLKSDDADDVRRHQRLIRNW